MSKRFDNKRLLYILAGLAGLLVLTILLRVPAKQSTLKNLVAEVDTADVRRIIFIPKKGTGDQFEFVKEKQKWIIKQGNLSARPVPWAVPNILGQIASMKPKGLAARDDSKWAAYEVTDTLATRIRLLNGKNRDLTDLLIGKFTYTQVENPYSDYGGANVEGTSYVRINGEKEVYTVDGFLAINFSGTFNDWRDKSFIRVNKDDILKIDFTCPGDSSFTLSLTDKKWLLNGIPADSAKVTGYLTKLSRIDGHDFEDGFTPSANPEYQMKVEGNNLISFTVKAYNDPVNGKIIMNSSLYPEVWFSSTRDGIFSDIFRQKSNFMK
jgi:hypothetical protein